MKKYVFSFQNMALNKMALIQKKKYKDKNTTIQRYNHKEEKDMKNKDTQIQTAYSFKLNSAYSFQQ